MRKVFIYYLYLFIVWGIYRFFTHFSEGLDELVFKPLIWLTPIIIIILFVEKKKLFRGIHLHFNTVIVDLLWGIGGSLFVFAIYIGSLYLKFGKLTFNPHDITLAGSLIFLVTGCATGLVEEATFRGFIFSRLRRDKHYLHSANVVTTILFVLIHFPIAFFVTQGSPRGIVEQMMITAELSLIDGYLFNSRKGLLAPVAAHAIWNFVNVWVI